MPNEPTATVCVACGNAAYRIYPPMLLPFGPSSYEDHAVEAARRRRQMYSALLTVVLLLVVGGAATAVVLRLRTDVGTPSTGLAVGAPTVGSSSAGPDVQLGPTASATETVPATFPLGTGGSTPGETGAATPSPVLTAFGIVSVAAIATDPAAPAVGDLFLRYFSGINTKNYAQALAALDPSGSIDTTDATQVRTFMHGMSTTSDSAIVVQSVAPDTSGGGALDVRVTFDSHQAAGYGPPGNKSQTCTAWNITYVLTPYGATYRIFKPATSSHSGC